MGNGNSYLTHVSLHATKVYKVYCKVSGVITSLIFRTGTLSSWVSFSHVYRITPGWQPQSTLNRRLGKAHSRSGLVEKSFAAAGIWTQDDLTHTHTYICKISTVICYLTRTGTKLLVEFRQCEVLSVSRRTLNKRPSFDPRQSTRKPSFSPVSMYPPARIILPAADEVVKAYRDRQCKVIPLLWGAVIQPLLQWKSDKYCVDILQC